MPNLHPLVVHFPVALLTVGLLFDLLGMVSKRDDHHRTGWWLHISGALGLILAVITGLHAEDSVEITEGARNHFEIHEQVAFATTAVFALLLAWRVGSKTRIPERRRPVYFMLSIAAVALLWVTAWYGGEMVYSFGVGVSGR